MASRTDIPKTPGLRLALTIDASGLRSSEIYKGLGWTSSRFAKYKSGKMVNPPLEAVTKLAGLLGFNVLWIYHSDLNGVTNRRLRRVIEKLLDGDWKGPRPNKRRGRPPEGKKAE